jgi:hypothetical protein
VSGATVLLGTRPGTRVSIQQPQFFDPMAVIRTPNLRLELSENCNERCRAGRIISISGEIVPHTWAG